MTNSAPKLPSGWEKASLSEVSLKITDGSHNPPKKKESGIPMLSAINIQNDSIVFDKVRYISESDFEAEYKRANITENDVLLTIVGTIGRTAVVKSKYPQFAIQRSVALIKPLEIDSLYLSFALRNPVFQKQLTQQAKGTAQKGVYLRTLNNLSVSIAPFAEQKRIVDKIKELFSELDEGIKSLKTAQQQLKVYRQAVLKWAFEGKLTAPWREEQQGKLESAETLLAQIKAEREQRYQKALEAWQAEVEVWEADGKVEKKPSKPRKPKDLESLSAKDLDDLLLLPNGWQWEKLGNLADITGGVTKGRKLDGQKTISLPYLRVANVQDGYLDLTQIKYIEVLPKDLNKYKLQYGDILYTEGGDRDKLGRGTIWKNEVEDCIHQNHIFRARLLSESINNKFIARVI